MTFNYLLYYLEKRKITIILWIIILILSIIFWLKWDKKSEWNFAIIPHFMLDSEKVDKFYNFLKNEYYNGWEPEKIILISPNHFHSQTKEMLTICKSGNVSYNSNTRKLSSELSDFWMKCDESGEIFEVWWDSLKTNEHGIWEHFQWINKYFPDSEAYEPCGRQYRALFRKWWWNNTDPLPRRHRGYLCSFQYRAETDPRYRRKLSWGRSQEEHGASA